jgi:ketosteroid isomerase-like protein
VVSRLVADLQDGRAPSELAAHFDEGVDWFIPGDSDVVPWIGRKYGRAGVAQFFRQFAELTVPEPFDVRALVCEGDHCVVLGDLVTLVRARGHEIVSDFALDVEVRGQLTCYHMLEDTLAAPRAFEHSHRT